MCISEQSLLEIEVLVGKTVVHWDYDFNEILMRVSKQNQEKNFFLIIPTLNKSI